MPISNPPIAIWSASEHFLFFDHVYVNSDQDDDSLDNQLIERVDIQQIKAVIDYSNNHGTKNCAADLAKAKPGLEKLSWTGPKLLGVKLVGGTDPEYPKSIMLAMQGLHPAFRPQRWVEFEAQRHDVVKHAKSLDQLKQRLPEQSGLIEDVTRRLDADPGELAYLPLVAGNMTDWIVIVSKKDGTPKGFVPVDSWL